MIRFNLDELLKKNKISRTKFAHLAKVRPNTINDMCNGNTRRIEVDTLNNIMRTINELDKGTVDLADLISYVKDE
ncbi:helix-turn-helix transcriptional regulator [Peribacillus simplex]|uniref:helix-turn-helix domain-containing protein n=1 Tax=Peribacillus simplex TaxID=1478 RepID=UPI0025A30300|nr:helix-turn-helix transcriptional regulator [Peribacillus simplex]MDM5291708.1 helix-turn-helix transcriptional regulator [Peribacillus simplex]